MVAVDDIGAFAAQVFSRPAQYLEKGVELAGDEKTFKEIKAIYTRMMGHKPRYLTLPAWLFAPMSKEMSTMFTWFKQQGFQAEIPKIKAAMPQVKGLQQALAEIKQPN